MIFSACTPSTQYYPAHNKDSFVSVRLFNPNELMILQLLSLLNIGLNEFTLDSNGVDSETAVFYKNNGSLFK